MMNSRVATAAATLTAVVATKGKSMKIQTPAFFIFFLLTVFMTHPVIAFQIHKPPAPAHTTPRTPRAPHATYNTRAKSTGTAIQMGLFDFFKTRENDFIKLQESQDVFGPGPLVLLYNVPNNIQDEELQAMMEDGAPSATKTASKSYNSGIKLYRIYPRDLEQQMEQDGADSHLHSRSHSHAEDTVLQVLEQAMEQTQAVIPVSASAPISDASHNYSHNHIPILYFSGISNQEMMQCYNIIAREIYEETDGMANPACAKVVQPAMGKMFKQLVEEISGDHADAIKISDESVRSSSGEDDE